ncbi:MAG: DUF2752 domain-containing protein [Gemmataceae bacterium]|nr:DUF2752 domain-containing protein [Gemmataceae bacterium]
MPVATLASADPRLSGRQSRRPLPWWVRLGLVAIVLGWLGVFAVAWKLDPYLGGKVWLEGTHRQMGLPDCTFKTLSGLPCPSCGMTSSFALLVRGDLVNAVRANLVGVGLALLGLAMIPWGLLSAWQARWLGFRKLEPVLLKAVVIFMVAMFSRWGIVLLWGWLGRT